MAKVLLVGIDGGTWNILKPLIADGKTKHFEEIVAEGVHGKLRSTIPYTTLPGWTSMFTGVNPGKHGLIDNIIYEDGEFKLANSSHREVDTIWRILHEKGFNSIVVNDPASYPPEDIGIHVTGLLTPPISNNYIYPRELRNEIDKVAGGYISDVPSNYYTAVKRSMNEAYRLAISHSEKVYKVARYLLKNYEWSTGCVIFTSTDRLQHFAWKMREYVYDHYEVLDRYIKGLLDIASEENANFLIASDHGFDGVDEFFYINSWLYKRGLAKPMKENIIERGMRKFSVHRAVIIDSLRKIKPIYRILRRIVPKTIKKSLPLAGRYRIDWERSKACAITNLGLFINKSLVRHEYEELRTRLIEEIRSLKSSTGEPIVRAVYRREEILFGPYIYRAPDIIIIPRTGYKIRSEFYTDFRLHSQPYHPDYGISPTGEHAIDGIFLAYGSDIARNRKINAVIWDIAPIILHMHGLPIPKYFDGRVVKEIFSEKSKLKSAPIKVKEYTTYRIVRRIKALKKSGKL